MRKKLKTKANYSVKRMCKSWGTLVDIAPSHSYEMHLTNATDVDALRSDLERIRNYLNKARSIYDGEWSEGGANGIEKGSGKIEASCRS